MVTVWLAAELVLPAKLLSPPYTAVIECGLPVTVRPVVASVAIPDPLRVPVPSDVTPSTNVTVPLGVPPVPDTVAVKVTDWP